jgi:hypothetical protein
VSYFVCYRPGCPIYTGVRPIGNSPTNRIYKIQFIITYCFLYLYRSSPPCPSSSRVWFNLYRFALKSGRLSSTKARGSLLLCSESIRSSSRKHGDYLGVARQFCVPTQLATPLGMKHRAVSGPFLLRRERHQQAAVYNGNMNSQSSLVDSNNSYADVARFFDMSTVSASPNSCYV